MNKIKTYYILIMYRIKNNEYFLICISKIQILLTKKYQDFEISSVHKVFIYYIMYLTCKFCNNSENEWKDKTKEM